MEKEHWRLAFVGGLLVIIFMQVGVLFAIGRIGAPTILHYPKQLSNSEEQFFMAGDVIWCGRAYNSARAGERLSVEVLSGGGEGIADAVALKGITFGQPVIVSNRSKIIYGTGDAITARLALPSEICRVFLEEEEEDHLELSPPPEIQQTPNPQASA
jgi:hypothetical protein